MVLLSGDIAQNYIPDTNKRKEKEMLKCSDKNGLVIQGNGQRYEFKNGDAVPERIFEKDFPANSGIEFKDALIEAGRIKETKEKEEVKKEEVKKEEVKKDEKDSKSTTTK